MCGRAACAKDGGPMDLFCPAAGPLGPIEWWPAHVAALQGRQFVLPDFTVPRGGGRGVVSNATELHLDAVMPPDKLGTAFADLLSLSPLGMTETERRELDVRGHSPHGSATDMARFLGFADDDVNELGHWLRDSNAKGQAGGSAPAVGGTGRAPGRANERGAMRHHYSSGEGRLGERERQLAVRGRWISAMAAAVARVDGEWTTMPQGREDWILLRD